MNVGTCREKKRSGIDVRPAASFVRSLKASNAILLWRRRLCFCATERLFFFISKHISP
jgi:hypothetical protein